MHPLEDLPPERGRRNGRLHSELPIEGVVRQGHIVRASLSLLYPRAKSISPCCSRFASSRGVPRLWGLAFRGSVTLDDTANQVL